ncbi:MAG: hypothetical protein GX053_11185 [Tissierella sp.]|nr:hypothetical protein [Tissierella sp.]
MNIKYKGKMVYEIIKEDNVIGHIYGVNLSRLDYSDENDLNEYISRIKEIIDGDEYKYIYIEESLPLNIKKIIADNLSINLSDSKDIKMDNIPYIIEALKSKLKRDIIKEEILIISNNKDEVLWIIDSISDGLNFLSVLGLNDSDGEDVYERVLDDIGISIYFPKAKSITLKRYGLIINTIDDISINLKDIKNNTFIIDFSQARPFAGVNRYVIEDVSIDISDLAINDNLWIGKEVSSDLYKCLDDKDSRKFCRIYKSDNLFTMEDLVNQSFKIKGGY